jgi:hypothetical protein
LASVFKDRYKLMQDQAPVLHSHIPLFFDVYDSQVDCLQSGHVIGELNFGFSVFPNTPVQVLNRVGRVNDFADFDREVKIAGELLPVGTPGLDSVFIF